jgi:hypothetical protein
VRQILILCPCRDGKPPPPGAAFWISPAARDNSVALFRHCPRLFRWKKLLVNRLASHEFNNYPIIREFVENLIQDFLSGKAPISSGSTTINDKNGFSKFLEYDIQPSEDNFILCFSDITEKERFKQKMEYINRLTSIGEMSAALTHEIRTLFRA